MKYQFCIRFDKVDVNSSASKAVLDCHALFSARGYKDLMLTVDDNADKRRYYYRLAKQIIRFFLNVKAGSLVGIQYPLLSINRVFKYIVKLARWKKVRFFCIVHDVESLRTGGQDKAAIAAEADALNAYDLVIVHNRAMLGWLKAAGVNRPMFPLELFDYLAPDRPAYHDAPHKTTIVYAGNLVKSTFIYQLPAYPSINILAYGPGFNSKAAVSANLKWGGVYSPEEIVRELNGTYGLVWDGTRTDGCDEVLGNYLHYNNPHKASLYLAAGMPLIAPEGSALAAFIRTHQVGFTIGNLQYLENAIEAVAGEYAVYKKNVMKIRSRVIKGDFFNHALERAEKELKYSGS